LAGLRRGKRAAREGTKSGKKKKGPSEGASLSIKKVILARKKINSIARIRELKGAELATQKEGMVTQGHRSGLVYDARRVGGPVFEERWGMGGRPVRGLRSGAHL